MIETFVTRICIKSYEVFHKTVFKFPNVFYCIFIKLEELSQHKTYDRNKGLKEYECVKGMSD